MTYAEKLKDPRWQKKRLEVMESHNWQCQVCYGKDETLHVHHDKYIGNPWEAPTEELYTLCESCHKNAHKYGASIAEIIALKVNGPLSTNIRIVLFAFDIFTPLKEIRHSYSDIVFITYKAYLKNEKFMEEMDRELKEWQ